MKDAALIEMLFTFGVVLAIAIWEIVRTPNPNKSKKTQSVDRQDRPGEE